jgi:mannitol-1-phosphate 5-dehydrogenase
MSGRTRFKISGTGCALVDYLYIPVNFNDTDFTRYLSKNPGDGGLSPGKLVFKEEFEKFSGETYMQVREKITKGKQPIALNIGGPSIVSLIHAAQMLYEQNAEVNFYGCKGSDKGGDFIKNKLSLTPINNGNFKTVNHYTPFTDVLSDPSYDSGSGERVFINNIGAAWEFKPSDLDLAFFDSDIVVFGGTALVPRIHSALCDLLKKARKYKAITVVNTVYDFLNEKLNPSQPWPLGNSIETYRNIDLLITDMEESLRLSGTGSVEAALNFFKTSGLAALIITHGSNMLHFFADSPIFGKMPHTMLPVSERIRLEISQNPEKAGDTTGCGDNFAGGVIGSIAKQLILNPGNQVNLTDAVAFGVASGGFSCFYHGGTFYEGFPGQKAQQIEKYYREYLIQIGHQKTVPKMAQKKLVLFGAGKIGRSFIGQVFSRSGFEVVFVDINREVIDKLNEHESYKVVIKNKEKDETILVSNVRGIHLCDEEKVITELADATVAALSVGQQGLPFTFPLIAKSLVLRKQLHGECPLDIIIAENLRNADLYISENLIRLLPEDYPFDKLTGLVETSIGKMVPIMSQKDLDEDPLQVFAEPYNSLIVAKNGFKNQIPEVLYLAPKDNIKAWVDRKLFIHNLGHTTVAYLGFQKNPKFVFIYEVLEDPDILNITRCTMLQSADILMELYPGEFNSSQLEAHIDDLLMRFKNKALGDTIFRAGCDLYRKLGPEDRLAAPIHAAIRLNKPFNLIFNALISGVAFRAKDENGNYFPADKRFFEEAENGVENILENICKLKLIQTF